MEHSESLQRVFTVSSPTAWVNEEFVQEYSAQTSPRKKIARHSQGAQKVCTLCFFGQNELGFDHPMPIGMTIRGQGKVRWDFCCKQPEMLEHGVILLQDSATPHCHHDVQNLLRCSDWEVLVHPPYSPDLIPCDYRLFAGKHFESEDDINAAVTASLHHLNKEQHL